MSISLSVRQKSLRILSLDSEANRSFTFFARSDLGSLPIEQDPSSWITKGSSTPSSEKDADGKIKSAAPLAEKSDPNKHLNNFIMLTNDDFKVSDEVDGEADRRRFDNLTSNLISNLTNNLTSNFEELSLNMTGLGSGPTHPSTHQNNQTSNLLNCNLTASNNVNHGNNFNNNFTSNVLMPPLPPRRSASATPTDSPLISPRHSSHQKPTRTHSNRSNPHAELDLDSRISEQSATFVKKPITYHQNNRNFAVSNSIFNGGTDSGFLGGFLKDDEDQQASKRTAQNNAPTNSFLNSSLNNLMDNELDGLPSQTKPSGRMLKTSKSSLLFSSSHFARRDEFERPDEDCLLTNVKAHELLESKERAFQDQHGKGICLMDLFFGG